MQFINLSILISGVYFYLAYYQNYPLVSSDFWGWQSGPKEMISYFLDHAPEYDEFYMDSRFNGPEILLNYYIRDPYLRDKSFFGGLEKLDLHKRQLFGIRREAFVEIANKDNFIIKKIVKYPNGNDAFYVIEHKLPSKSDLCPVVVQRMVYCPHD